LIWYRVRSCSSNIYSQLARLYTQALGILTCIRKLNPLCLNVFHVTQPWQGRLRRIDSLAHHSHQQAHATAHTQTSVPNPLPTILRLLLHPQSPPTPFTAESLRCTIRQNIQIFRVRKPTSKLDRSSARVQYQTKKLSYPTTTTTTIPLSLGLKKKTSWGSQPATKPTSEARGRRSPGDGEGRCFSGWRSCSCSQGRCGDG
jgi:hypothetical protein